MDIFLKYFFISSLLLDVSVEAFESNVLASPFQTFLDRNVFQMTSHKSSGIDLKNTTSQCASDLAALFGEIKETWTIEMLDAWGKIPSGVLLGNLNSLGSFSECLRINYIRNGSQDIIRGKYCIAKLALPIEIGNMVQNEETHSITRQLNANEDMILSFNLGVCIPSSCNGSEIMPVLQNMLNMSNGIIPDFLSDLGKNITIPEGLCSLEDKGPLSYAQIGAIFIFTFFGILLLLSTAYDIWSIFVIKDKTNQNALLTSFSVYNNTKRLMTPSSDPGPLACLHGIRVLSIFWVVLGHRYSFFTGTPIENYKDALKWSESYWSMAILAATVSVDTFFLLSGLLLSYIFFRQVNASTFFQKLPVFYLHRFIRLTPALAAMVLFQATLLNRVGNGPFWSIFETMNTEYCKKTWWSTLLYVQNYVNPKEICVVQSWFLSVDMQLFIISPILLYPLLRNAKVGLVLVMVWIILAQTALFVVAYIREYWAATVGFKDPKGEEKYTYLYMVTHLRATPWLIGILAGYLIRNISKKSIAHYSRRSKIFVCVGWISCFGIMAGVILGMQPLQLLTHEFSYLEDTTYLAFSRTAWSVAVLWLILACAFGYGGPINWFLSFKIWEILGRLSYSIYLVHLVLQMAQLYSVTHVQVFSHTMLVYDYFADLIISIFLAYIMVITFESPISVLEKYIFGHGKAKSIVKEPKDIENQGKTMENNNSYQQ